MCEHVASLDFSFIDLESVDTSARKLTNMIFSVCDSFVEKRTLLERDLQSSLDYRALSVSAC